VKEEGDVSISATEGVAPGLFGGATGATATAQDKDTFLQLLVAQLRYQDPMNPTDSSDFLAQSAQFTALEKMEAVAAQTAAMVQAQLAFGASSLVGTTVTYADPADPAATVTGVVDSVTFGAQGPVLDIDGTSVPLAALHSVSRTPA